MPNYQAEIAANVAARGYREGWTDEQYAARQVCKLGEELGEAVHQLKQCYSDDPSDLAPMPAWMGRLSTAQIRCREAFDNRGSYQWDRVFIRDRDALIGELTDMQVVLAVAGHALGVDLNALALEKSRADVERGVR